MGDVSHYVKGYNLNWLRKPNIYYLEGEIGMKRKILACVVACATLFLGMGYAFWTSSLQIDTTATTGELNVTFCDLGVYGQYADEQTGWAIFTGIPDEEFVPANFFDRTDVDPDDINDQPYNIIATEEQLDAYAADVAKYTKTAFGAGLENPENIPDDIDEAYGPDRYWDGWWFFGNWVNTNTDGADKINVDITKIYPGYAQMFRTDILNTGTLAAKLSDIDVTLSDTANDNDTIKDMIGISVKVFNEDGKAVKVLNADAADTFTIEGVDFVRLSALEAGDVTVNAGDGDDLLYIMPGVNTMDAIFGVAMDPDYDGAYTTGHVGLDPASTADDADSQLKDAGFTIDFLWDQFNVDAEGYEDDAVATAN